ncbi:MAG: ParB/RepB/Spo0J family partition protein [Ruminococcaceae bacterium]|jgi:ParB family chromosome partitioning protein|nr:ParB/RepB/Spo0J family partition protein [Oscillospiraceae bacterium]
MANTTRGLGKGLGALFGEDALRSDSSDNIRVPISQIENNADQPRRHFDDDALDELADSIREHGILQPLNVRRLSNGYYQIIAGERRWRAAKLAGLKEVPVIIMEADDRKVMELALIENLQREDLDPLEEAEGYKKLMDSYSMTQEDVAKRVGKSRSTVANALRLLGLCPEARALLEAGKLTGGHARALLPLSPALQKKAAQEVVDNGLSVRQTEALVKRYTAKPKPEKQKDPQAIDYVKLAAGDLTTKLGRACRIVPGKKKGKIELEYYGMDDLNDLLDALALIKKRDAK